MSVETNHDQDDHRFQVLEHENKKNGHVVGRKITVQEREDVLKGWILIDKFREGLIPPPTEKSW